jgi:hypothetical protein
VRRARGALRVSAAERREIKDEIASRLVAQALPTPRLFDVVWNLETGRVYFSGKQRAAREAFGDCFRRTFGNRGWTRCGSSPPVTERSPARSSAT